MTNVEVTIPELMARQVRAARALLAWTQQELAERASISASTVADFERGHRNPVADNIAAIRQALEDAGIGFPSGGAVVGKVPNLTAQGTIGASPIRLIDATDLSNWANRRSCQDTLPELICRLIRASMGPAASLRFPSGDSIQQSDWDGVCKIDAATSDSYIPSGASGWEIGTQGAKIKAKADEDYQKRSTNALGLVPSRSTFVFVTPRRWTKKRAWVAEREKDGVWAEVRAFDADDLVHWIELFPAVGTWLAIALGKRPSGVKQLDEAWREWSCSTRWPLTEDLILGGRDEQSTAILRWLYGPPSVFSLQADSAAESEAFLYATLRQLPPEYQEYYYARTLLASTSEVARFLSDSASRLLIVLEDGDPGLTTLLAQRGHHVYLTAGSEGEPSGLRLARPFRETIRRSLVDMGIDEGRAESLAQDSGRSLAVLRRLMPASSGTITPEWATPEYARLLIPALFAGAWDEASEGDRRVLARLSGETYEKWISSITQWMNRSDGPLRREGNAWKIASARDAWFRLAPYASSVDIENFSAVATDVLGERSPLYDMNADERWMAPVRGHRPKHSAFLRKGIAETLVLLSVFGRQLRCASDASAKSESIVRRLLDGADASRWWSLSELLQSLAEAAPDGFLSAVDDSLSIDSPPIIVLFKEEGGVFGGAYHSHLLWALEILAWSPHYLARVTEILAKLAERDPGGRFSNRPKNSLRNIFLLWRPHTYATLDQRLLALDYLRRLEPSVAWELLMRTIPTGHDIAEPTSKPRWRDFAPNEEEIVTYGLLARGASEITNRLLEDARLEGTRWTSLIESYANLPSDKREPLLKGLSVAVGEICDAATKMKIRGALRRFLHQHRAYPEAKWRLPAEELLRLDEIYRLLEPSDLIDKFGWLFSSQGKELPRPSGKGWKEDEALAHQLQRDAIRDVLVNGGEDGFFRFANSLEAPAQAGFVLAEVIENREWEHRILCSCLNSKTAIDADIARGMLFGLFQRGGDAWVDAILRQAKDERWAAETITKVVLTLRPSRFVWDWLARFEPQVENSYWSRTDLFWMDGTPEDRAFAANKLIEAHRARAAIHFMGHTPKDFPSSLLVRALYEALGEPWSKDEVHASTMFVYSVEEILLRLDKSPDVTEDEIAALEWALLPLLQHSHRRPPGVLHRKMSTSPAFFVEVISAVYRPDPESGVAETAPADMQRARAIATQAYELLHSWALVPGENGGAVNGPVLEEWVKEARILCKNAGRLAVGDQHIGSVLANGPSDSAGVWPTLEIRELIEITRGKDVEKGFVMGVHNRRGVTTRGMTDGGAQERELVKTYREWSRNMELKWPRTSALLERIASSYEHEARRQDEEAERNQW